MDTNTFMAHFGKGTNYKENKSGSEDEELVKVH